VIVDNLSEAMKKLFQISFLIVVMLTVCGSAIAGDCPACGAKELSGLTMLCPECNADLHDITTRNARIERSSLRVRLLYTGDKPDRLPAYGKLYINGKYHGNIDLVEKEERNSEFAASWNDGLGREYTALYEKVIENVTPGVLKIEVEMKFDRLYSLGRSYKKVVFPYVGFKEGEKTTVDHYFNSAATFNQYKPGKRKPIPIVSETKLQGASGTVAINVGLFK